MSPPSTKLVRALIAKSIAETLLVGALAVLTFITLFPPHFHGWGEVTNEGIAGWAANDAFPWHRVEVQLYVDGKFVADAVANGYRPDVLQAGWAKDEWHGYLFLFPALSLGQHEARVYALHNSGDGVRKSLQLLGDPILFAVDESGKPVKVDSR